MRRALTVSAVACTGAFAGVWLSTPLPNQLRIGGIDLLWFAAAVILTVSAFWAARLPENAHLRRPLTLLGGSGLLWAAGQAVWTYEELVRGVASPIFSIADIGYVLSVVLQALAILTWPREPIRWDVGRVLDIALIFGFATLFGIEFILESMLAADMDGIASLYAIAYPAAEIALFAAIVAVFMLAEWHDRARLELTAFALLAICAGDAGYTYLGDAYETGGVLDPLWTIGLTGVAIAAALPADWRGRRSLIGDRGRLFAPAAALIVLALAALGVHWADGTDLARSAPFALLGLIVLLAVRQGHAQVRLGAHVAEQRRLEQQLQHAQKMEAVGRLAGGVAHDFNNILTVIDGYSDLAVNQLAADHPAREDFDEVRRAADRAAELTRGLLAFSRRQVFAPRVVDLNGAVADTQRMLCRLAGADVAIATSLAPRPVLVLADPGQLEQVITNLVVNARDAMPDGGAVTIATSVTGDRVRLTVADTGVGMTDEVQARLFEPFFTTKETGKGTGLGLAIVHGIVKQSSGEIAVTSAPGRGTRFEIDFPAAEATAGEEAGEDAPIATTGGTGTVLLVEDERAVRELARRMLERAGYTVVTASSGEEALELFGQAGPVDVLVTDVVMPRMNGHEVANRLRDACPRLAVVLMSGYSQEAEALDRLRAAGAAFLGKPFTSQELVAEVRGVLEAAA